MDVPTHTREHAQTDGRTDGRADCTGKPKSILVNVCAGMRVGVGLRGGLWWGGVGVGSPIYCTP